MWIHQRSLQEEFQKTWCGLLLFERPGDHLMQLNELFYDKLMLSLTYYFGGLLLFWRAQLEARKKELQVQAVMALNHVTPFIMEFKGD